MGLLPKMAKNGEIPGILGKIRKNPEKSGKIPKIPEFWPKFFKICPTF